MTTYTPNLNLKKPSTGEYYDMIADLNDTKDKIDKAFEEVVVNVKYFGAKGDYDGTSGTDDTVAFNLATKYAEILTGNNTLLKAKIFVPPGQYLITGTIYLRKGQHLEGSGAGVSRLIIPIATTEDVIVMGKGLINGVVEYDTGGLPCTISDLGFEGGLGSAINSTSSGAFVRDLMFTGCNKCITVDNGDVLIENIIMDICPNGIVINPNSQNIIIDNVIAYQGNYDLSFYGQSNDIHVSNFHSEYCQYSSILFSNGCNVTNLSIDNSQFLLNGQYETFEGFIADWANVSDYIVSNTTFRNMKGFAVIDRSGISHKGIYNNCIFDGKKTNILQYDQSTTSKGMFLQNSDITLINCKFRNLNDTIIEFVGTEVAKLTWKGGEIENCSAEQSMIISNTNENSTIYLENIDGGRKQLFNAQSVVKVRAKNLMNWFKVINNGTYVYTLIPYQGGKIYKVVVSANTNPAGSGDFKKTRVELIGTQIGFTSAIETILESATLFNSSANTAPAISLDYGFDSAGGAKTKTGAFLSGLIAIFVPTNYYVDFDIQEEI